MLSPRQSFLQNMEWTGEGGGAEKQVVMKEEERKEERKEDRKERGRTKHTHSAH